MGNLIWTVQVRLNVIPGDLARQKSQSEISDDGRQREVHE
jgi:hypothetical protein